MDVFFDWADNLIKNHDTIWGKVSADIKKEFDSKPVYNKKFLKTKIKSNKMKLQIFTISKFLR